MMLLQFILLDDPLLPVLIVGLIVALFISGYIKFISHRRNQMIEEINRIMTFSPSVSATELVGYLDATKMDRKTLHSLVKNAELAMMSFSKTSIVSVVFLESRLKDSRVNNSIVHVDKEAMRWDISPSIIDSMIEDISQKEGLDILKTKDGDFLLVPDLKERIKESLELQGRADIVSESQRLRVDIEELVRMIKTWGWHVWQSTSGFMYSVKWLLGTLERNVAKLGYLDLESEAARLDLTPDDILTVIRLYKWEFVQAHDKRIIPIHLLKDSLLARLDRYGSLNLVEEANRLKVPKESLEKILKGMGLTLISTKDGFLMTLEQIRQEMLDDAALSGTITPKETAERLGVEEGLAERILGNQPGIRRIKGGRFLSYRALRSYILDEVRKTGVVYTDDLEKKWSLNRIELAAILKQFGLKTVLTKSGNYLSTSWMRRWLSYALLAGETIDPKGIAERFEIDSGVIDSILATVQTDTLIDGSGQLIGRDALYNELELQFKEMGILRPSAIATERGLDISDINRTLQPLHTWAYPMWDDGIVSKDWVLGKIVGKLQKDGFFDLDTFCEKMELNYDDVYTDIEARLPTDAHLLEQCGTVVSDKWIELLRSHAEEVGSINVESFASTMSLPKKAALCLLRHYLQGVYLPSSDTFFVKV